jgi:hypothetical protein
VTDDGYRGVLLGARTTKWQTELRMPLIQRALADMYGRPLELFSVGFQELDGSALDVVQYSARQDQRAVRALGALADEVLQHLSE